MQFEVLQEQLVKGLSLVARAVGSRPQLPVLSNVLLEVKRGAIVLSATDLELSIRTKVSAKVEEEGVVSVPARMFLDFVSSLAPGKVQCSLNKEALELVSGEYRGKIQTISAEEFPSMPNLQEEAVLKIEGKEWSRGVETVQFAAAKDALRPVLTGVLIECGKGSLKMVATDGFRLSARELAAAGKGWEEGRLVPARAVLEVEKLLEEGEELEIVLYPETNQMAFRQGAGAVVTQLLAGNFPEYGRIIPKEFEGSVEVGREELLSALRAVHIFARENSNVVRFAVSEEGIRLSAETPEKGEADAMVAGELEGEEGEIVFNAKFVLDYLQAASAEKIVLSMSGALSPGLLREMGKKEPEEKWLYVVMPINA